MGTHENTHSGKRGRATTLNHFKIDRRNSDKIAIRHMVKEKNRSLQDAFLTIKGLFLQPPQKPYLASIAGRGIL